MAIFREWRFYGERLNFSQGESITFRATTTGVLTTLQHCLDIVNERDESWKKRLDKEIERRRRSEGQSRKYKDELKKTKNASFPGPDLEVSFFWV